MKNLVYPTGLMVRQSIFLVSFMLFSHYTKAQKTDFFMGETVNYDETKVPHYMLPDVLTSLSGQKVSGVKFWEKMRRPEVLGMFEEHVYGKMPKGFERIKFKVNRESTNAMEGRATLKEVDVVIFNRGDSVVISMVLFLPNNLRGRAPAFLLINNRSKRNMDPSRTVRTAFWPAELAIDSGYAVAAFHVADAAPDRKDRYQDGVLKRLYPEMLAKSNGMKAIGSWAWAASRVMDYLVAEPRIDPKRIGIVGHSRGGKTALWAAAQDSRFSMVFSSCSGSTGASLARRRFGETVSLINKQFGYWFCDNYNTFSNDVDNLPIDQHMLISLIAPRPVYTTNATEDRWADPYGSYLSLIHAVPVYKLYQKHVDLPLVMPGYDMPILNSTIGYHFRKGIHDLNLYDWTNFIRFANLNNNRK